MKRLFICLLLASFGANAQVKKAATAPKVATKTVAKPTIAVKPVNAFKNSADSAGYALGVRIGQNLKAQGFDAINLPNLYRAIGDVFTGKASALPEAVLDKCIGEFVQKANEQKSAGAKKEGVEFLAANAKKPGVVTLASGLQYVVVKAGADTTRPKLTDKVKCHYHGTLLNGSIFDSSMDRGEPVVFPVNGVIKGWQEALQLMTVGSKWKLYVPSDLAYGDSSPSPSIGPGSLLVFDVELISIEKE
jgi:FKBP-type peptidyl-prolyl cis-trans isomerase FklB